MSSAARSRIGGGILGAAGLIAILTVASRLVGFVRWMVHSHMLGGGSMTAGAYASANQVPNILYEVAAGGALASVVVPLLATPIARAMRRDVDRIASGLLTWALLALVPLAIVVALCAGWFAGLLHPAALEPADGAAYDALLASLLRVFAVQIPFYGVGIILSGILQAHRRFFWPAAAPLLSSAVVIGSYLVFGALADGNQDNPGALSDAAVAWLAWGTTGGVIAMSLCQLPAALRLGVRLRPTLAFAAEERGRVLRLAGAGIGALLAQQAAMLTVLAIAPRYGDAGTISIYQYALAVYVLPYAILAVPLGTAMFPRLAEVAGTRSHVDFARLAVSSTRLILVVAFVGMALLVAAAPAAAPLFGLRGATAAGMTTAIAWFAPGVVGYALVFHSSRVLYAVDRGRAAVSATALGWATVVAASVVLARLLAPGGGDGEATLRALASGNSIGMLVAGVGLLVATVRCSDRAAAGRFARTVAVGALAALAGGWAGRFTVDQTMALIGADSAVGAVLGAIPGAVVALVGTLGAVAVLDRQALAPAISRLGRKGGGSR